MPKNDPSTINLQGTRKPGKRPAAKKATEKLIKAEVKKGSGASLEESRKADKDKVKKGYNTLRAINSETSKSPSRMQKTIKKRTEQSRKQKGIG